MDLPLCHDMEMEKSTSNMESKGKVAAWLILMVFLKGKVAVYSILMVLLKGQVAVYSIPMVLPKGKVAV